MSVEAAVEAPPGMRLAEEHTFAVSDGAELFYRAWPPEQPSQKAVVLFHRGHEHSARWQDFIDRINLPDCWCFAWDARGHGRSPGERGYAESFTRMVQDADEFVRCICDRHGIRLPDIAVVGHSVGAVLAATWVHDYAPPVRALVLAAPAFRVKLYVPLAIPGLRLLNRIRPKSFLKSYVKPRLLTHDAEQARLYAGDKDISPQIAVNILLDLFDTSRRLVADAGAIHAPVLLLVSGTDRVVRIAPQRRFFERLSSRVREMELYEGFYHSTYREQERERPIARTREFLIERFDAPPDAPDVTGADRSGYSRDIYDCLRTRLSPLSPKRVYYAAQRLLLKTLGRLSRGIRIGWRAGFDSGESLDHVYRNRAEGFSPLGRLIDRVYLNAPGWKGIRTRKAHVSRMLDRAIAEISRHQRAVRILDVASGPGRYVLEAIERHRDVEIAAVLRDRDAGGLAAGRRLAEAMGVRTVTYCEGDAFDGDELASLAPPPDIAVVSGLYELFPENERVRQSLRGLRAAVRPGGFLIYTNQPWHPQQEMIARVLPNRDGEPWIMRCRSQAEMDQLAAEAGFNKREMLIDEAGIFTVSLAVRRPE